MLSPRGGGSTARIVVVGGGAGGVELALSMHARLTRELAAKPGGTAQRASLEVSLVLRSRLLMPQHSAGVREIFVRLVAERGIRLVHGAEVTRATSTAHHCSDGTLTPHDEAVGCADPPSTRNRIFAPRRLVTSGRTHAVIRSMSATRHLRLAGV